ncbi:hypothetical protein ERJ75_000007000 [Trypanosoma vivax]|nr:hypothetical protein ERJ75_000007000 [Trypanosoma vivax]
MDCGAGFAIGQQLAKNALHMHGSLYTGPAGSAEQDALMTGNGAPGDWAQHFSLHCHHHKMAMQQQQNDAMMIHRQQREMEEAFRVASVAPQSGVSGASTVSSHMMVPPNDACWCFYDGRNGANDPLCAQLVGGPPMNPLIAPQESSMLTRTPDALNQQQISTDAGWAEELRTAEWGKDYSDVPVHTVENQPVQTAEEHAKESKFYQFMDKIRNRELVVDDEAGQVVEGPGPDPDVAADLEYLRNLAATEDLNLPPGVFDHMEKQALGASLEEDEAAAGMSKCLTTQQTQRNGHKSMPECRKCRIVHSITPTIHLNPTTRIFFTTIPWRKGSRC